VPFDVDGDGALEQVSWTASDWEVAFLAVDRDNNGTVDNGTELFGTFTYPGIGNGYNALERMQRQSHGTGWGSVTSRDRLFARLLLWTDRNHNGVSEPSELRPTGDVLANIGIGYQRFGEQDEHGNQYRFKGFVHVRTGFGENPVKSKSDDDARRRDTYEVLFHYARN